PALTSACISTTRIYCNAPTVRVVLQMSPPPPPNGGLKPAANPAGFFSPGTQRRASGQALLRAGLKKFPTGSPVHPSSAGRESCWQDHLRLGNHSAESTFTVGNSRLPDHRGSPLGGGGCLGGVDAADRCGPQEVRLRVGGRGTGACREVSQ